MTLTANGQSPKHEIRRARQLALTLSHPLPVSAMKYLKSCKAIEYVRVDGKPGLTHQRGRCRFWTSVVVTPEVVRLEPD